MSDFALLLQPDTCEGTLSISGTSLFTDAWWITDMSAIDDTPDLVGSDWPVPGQDGDDPQARSITATRKSFPMVMIGAVDAAGTPYADPWQGLVANFEALYAAVLAQPATIAGTRPAIWTQPDGVTTRSADVHVLGLRKQRHPGAIYVGVLELSVPAGRFT